MGKQMHALLRLFVKDRGGIFQHVWKVMACKAATRHASLNQDSEKTGGTWFKMQGCFIRRGSKNVSLEPTWYKPNSEHNKSLALLFIPD